MTKMCTVSIGQISLFFLVCWRLTSGDSSKENNNPSPHHIFHDPQFWSHFETQVRSKFFSCNFIPELLTGTLGKDANLYANDTIFRRRRLGALKFVENDTLWIDLALGVCRERADGVRGPHSKKLADLHMLEAFEDYVDHLDYFQRVAAVMETKGQVVQPLSQGSSKIHDIDKLDPVMMVGYSERFEDSQETSVWDVCVTRHTTVNPHHQAHCLWHSCCRDSGKCNFCEVVRNEALKEMVCDKVSRRVQKNLDGKMSDKMWDVEVAYFAGISQEWIDKAVGLMNSMKGSNSLRRTL